MRHRHHNNHHIDHVDNEHLQHDEHDDEHKYRDHIGRADNIRGANNHRGRAIVCRKRLQLWHSAPQLCFC